MKQPPSITCIYLFNMFFINRMKRYLNFYLLALIFLYSSSLILAQSPGTEANELTKIQVRTPEVSNFMKYGGLSSASYTGALKLELPIASMPIKDNGSLNVSLEYTGSGFKPAMRDGIVGQGWTLNVGGAISRQVNGVPDTQKGRDQNFNVDGFMIGVQVKTHTPSNVFNFNSNTTYLDSHKNPLLFANSNSNTQDSRNYEADPDMFFFNFNGISGRFFMGNDGVIKVATNTPVKLKVDVSSIGTEDSGHSHCFPNPSEIVITDDGGNKYFFGGATKNLDYSLVTENISSHQVQSQHNNNNPVIDTWHMNRVEYYNGYIITFNYKNDSALNEIYNGHFADLFKINRDGDPFPGYLGVNDNIRDFIVLNEFYSENQNIFQGSGSLPETGFSLGTANYNLGLTIQKRAILESITSSDFSINFYYSRQAHDFNRRTGHFDPKIERKNFFYQGFYDIKLDRVSVNSRVNGFQATSFGKTYYLKYESLGGVFDRLFLTSLKESGKPEHKLIYNPTGNLPVPITRGVDHWGYWNGRNADTNKTIPTTQYLATGDYYFTSNSRDPNFNEANKGQLNEIIYPTGGRSTFQYEGHTYTKRLQAVSSNAFIPGLINEGGIAGGIRIHKIEDRSQNNGLLGRKEYVYEGGLLMKWPRYTLYYKLGPQAVGYIRTNPIGRHLEETLHMTYSQVTEKNIGNGKTVTKFRDFMSNGDDYIYNWRYIDSPTPLFEPENGDNLAKGYFSYLLNDRSIERGKPKWVQTYDNSNNMVEETIFTYNEASNRFNQFSTKLHLTGPFIEANKLYFYSDFLTKKEHRNYLDGGTLTTITHNGYDDNLKKIITTTTTNSDNSTVTVENDYQIIDGINLVLKDETRSLKDGVTTSVQYTNYGDHTNPNTNYKYYPKEIGSYKYIPGQTEAQMIDNAKKVFVNKYDTKGNPLEVSVSNGNVISYIWGYGESLLLAKIEGIAYSQIPTSTIQSLQTLSNLDRGDSYNNIQTENDLKQALNGLRNILVLSNTLITTYTHNPLTGVTSTTDARGNSQQYEYDGQERLLIIKDKDGKSLLKHEYNYKPQN